MKLTKQAFLFVCCCLPITSSATTISLFAHDYSYVEPEFMRIDGTAVGVELSHAFELIPSFDLELTGSKSFANVTYNAHTGGASVYDTDDNMSDINIRLTKSFDSPISKISTSIGLGKYKVSDLPYSTGTQNEYSTAYDRIQKYNYFLLGIKGSQPINTLWSSELGYEHRFLGDGEIVSKLSQTGLGGAYSFDVLCKQSSGSGSNLFASLIFNKEVSLTLFRNTWDIADSNTCFPFAFVEPANQTTSNGVKIGYHF